jgi:hypothetical protein
MNNDTSKIIPATPTSKPIITTQTKAIIAFTITVTTSPDIAPQQFSDSMQIDCIASLRQCPSDYKDQTARAMADKFYAIVLGLIDNP